ncbi:hypothetical protein [Kordiimonas marina]|uniref:hypothetical protein n=1 Tax=Kordiimonas marina TaxID=2872312 RepID=UPI001FF41E49|nr:hypothetical protein [Kordiimonas marina]MCJ9428170.1 hypothetical protein [Kordiimonas marina]
MQLQRHAVRLLAFILFDIIVITVGGAVGYLDLGEPWGSFLKANMVLVIAACLAGFALVYKLDKGR